MDNELTSSIEKLYNDVRSIIENARATAYRADYGSRLLASLSGKLSAEYGKGFDKSNLRNMRKFYQIYQKRDALRGELSWTVNTSLLQNTNYTF